MLIRDALLASPLQTIAFVNPRAISAGALISLAADRIAMAEGATIGAVAGTVADTVRAPVCRARPLRPRRKHHAHAVH